MNSFLLVLKEVWAHVIIFNVIDLKGYSKNREEALFEQGTSYIEGSGVGVLDLFLISSMVNESILESIFAGLLLI